jgi:hypothetical protein
VLKEQSNVDRHNPDVCYDGMANLRDAILSARANLSSLARIARTNQLQPLQSSNSNGIGASEQQQQQEREASPRSSTIAENSFSSANRTATANQQSLNHLLAVGYNSLSTSHIQSNRTASGNRRQLASDNNIKRQIIVNHRDHKEESQITTRRNDHDQINDTVLDEKFMSYQISLLAQYSPLLNSGPIQVCQDAIPKFVAQSSICWYVLGAGLSCYLVDLIMRRWRRNKNPIELLSVRSDAEGNLIELTLSNNHRRFAYWMPGQFVYLNCPQIATYEWHPFTISSMDNRARQFTLHIKTGGDWTRKLRHELDLRRQQGHQHQPSLCNSKNSMSLFSRRNTYSFKHCCDFHLTNGPCEPEHSSGFGQALGRSSIFHERQHGNINLPSFDCNDLCLDRSKLQFGTSHGFTHPGNGSTRKQLQLNVTSGVVHSIGHGDKERSTCCCSFVDKRAYIDNLPVSAEQMISPSRSRLDLFIDGPFHSPFERLLEQQVSICIANGVGWTAFSSVFQRITNNGYTKSDSSKDQEWWSEWRDFLPTKPNRQNDKQSNGDVAVPTLEPYTIMSEQKLSNETKLHLIIIVTSIEQLKPFYSIVMKYYQRLKNSSSSGIAVYDPIREISAYITRCKYLK